MNILMFSVKLQNKLIIHIYSLPKAGNIYIGV
jgi:hypothetical protein